MTPRYPDERGKHVGNDVKKFTNHLASLKDMGYNKDEELRAKRLFPLGNDAFEP